MHLPEESGQAWIVHRGRVACGRMLILRPPTRFCAGCVKEVQPPGVDGLEEERLLQASGPDDDVLPAAAGPLDVGQDIARRQLEKDDFGELGRVEDLHVRGGLHLTCRSMSIAVTALLYRDRLTCVLVGFRHACVVKIWL